MRQEPCSPVKMEWRTQVFGSLGSTQDLVKEFADRGEEEGYAVQALTQSEGRGRQGNAWEAPMGNLYLSFLLRPECSLNDAGQLAFVAAVALSEAIDLYMEKSHIKTLKWPNDILIDNKKISGILLESQTRVDGSLEYIVVGVGVNVLAPPEGRAGLQDIAENRVAINVFRDDFLACMKVAYHHWQEKGFAEIRQNWLKQAHGLEEPMQIRLPEGTSQGIFKGVDENGALLAEIDGEQKTVNAGEVHFGV